MLSGGLYIYDVTYPIDPDNPLYAIFDSGNFDIMLTGSDHSWFLNQNVHYIDDLDCQGTNCKTTTTTCEDLWPELEDFVFKLGDMYYSLAPEAYTYPIITSDDSVSGCLIAVSESPSYTYLGLTFLRNFNVVFDHTNSQVKLNVSPTATAGTVKILDKIPDPNNDNNDDSDGLSGGAIFGIIAGALVFIILIVLLTCYLVKKNR